MSTIRYPEVAGSFYPADIGQLRGAVADYLLHARGGAGTQSAGAPKALIVPHAGYRYSGPVAASAYARLAAVRDQVHYVVLIGPSHRLAFQGLAASSADSFLTPLGSVGVSRILVQRALALPQVRVLDAAHEGEHSLEVHIPFLQQVLANFTIVPLLVGNASAAEVVEVLDLLWNGPETLVVVSSDLSHHHDYQTARTMDAAAARAIEGLQPEALTNDQACGCRVIRGLLEVARRRKDRITAIDLRNSGDTSRSRDEVVGYGAFVVEEPRTEPL